MSSSQQGDVSQWSVRTHWVPSMQNYVILVTEKMIRLDFQKRSKTILRLQYKKNKTELVLVRYIQYNNFFYKPITRVANRNKIFGSFQTFDFRHLFRFWGPGIDVVLVLYRLENSQKSLFSILLNSLFWSKSFDFFAQKALKTTRICPVYDQISKSRMLNLRNTIRKVSLYPLPSKRPKSELFQQSHSLNEALIEINRNL